MIERATRLHGLEGLLDGQVDTAPADPGVVLEIPPAAGHLNLRGDPGNDRFTSAVAAVLGQALPLLPNTMTTAPRTVCWLGPDEWLVSCGPAAAPALVAKLEHALAGLHAAVNDISGGQVVFRLHGLCARDVLMAGCTLDFHPRAFPAGTCAQSGLAKTNALIILVEEAPVYELVVRRSFAPYVFNWVRHTGSEYGLAVSRT